jgi:hypothetical protein
LASMKVDTFARQQVVSVLESYLPGDGDVEEVAEGLSARAYTRICPSPQLRHR